MGVRARFLRIGLALLFTIASGETSAQKREQIEIALSEGRTLSGILYVPQKATPAAAVIVLHTAYGSVENFDEEYARMLAEEGFVAIAPNYIHPFFGGRLWSPGITTDMAAIVEYLRRRAESREMPIGTVGFSLGSRGLLLAARRSEIKAVVVYYGTYDIRKEKGLKLPPAAVVPMQVASEVNAAVLLLHGAADDEIPIASARTMRAALLEAGKTVELVEYPGAYHRFDRGPAKPGASERSPQGYLYRKDGPASADAYRRTVQWLKEHLR